MPGGKAGANAGDLAGQFSDETERRAEEEREQQPHAVADERVAANIARSRTVWSAQPWRCELQRYYLLTSLFLFLIVEDFIHSREINLIFLGLIYFLKNVT